MKFASIKFLYFAIALFFISTEFGAQATAPAAGQADPRIGLKAGYRDAGAAARNIELVTTMPKPEGFFDPKAPLGVPSAPEPTPGERGGGRGGRGGDGNVPAGNAQAATQPAAATGAGPRGAPAGGG